MTAVDYLGQRVPLGSGVGVVRRGDRETAESWGRRLDALEAEALRGACRVRRLGPVYVVVRQPQAGPFGQAAARARRDFFAGRTPASSAALLKSPFAFLRKASRASALRIVVPPFARGRSTPDA